MPTSVMQAHQVGSRASKDAEFAQEAHHHMFDKSLCLSVKSVKSVRMATLSDQVE